MAIVIRKYNPGFLSDEELVASFCVRTSEFASLVEMLRECTGNSNPHQLVIGPRGSGKTTLLRRVAAEVGRDEALSANFFPIVFAEESYEVATVGEFWLECLSRLAVQAPRREDGLDLHRTYDELRTVRDDQTLENRCLGVLLDFSDREGKRLVLMAENLDMMFKDIADQDDTGWRLRKVLQTEPRIVLLASATSRFDQIDHPDQALYDLFRVLRLRPLDTQECSVLWEMVSGHKVQSRMMRSLQILTGGDPRLVVLVARFGAERSFRNLMVNLLDLIDEHTAYLKSHIEQLAAQERRVYLALADLWKPATTKEIADRTRLETSKCSAQLTRLVERSFVEVDGGTARRKQYYLTQRLYNIYYLLRRPRGPDRLVEALIHFMEAFYAPDELRDIGMGMARDVDDSDGEMRTLHQTALAQLLALPALAEHRDTLLTAIPPDLSEVLARVLVPPGRTESEWAGVEPTPHRAGQRRGDTSTSVEITARKMIEKGETFHEQERLEEALTAYDEVVRRYGASEVPALREAVALALHRMGDLLWELERPEEALATCDEVIRRYGTSEVSALREAVVVALVNKGLALRKLERPEEALATYHEVIRRYGTSEVSALREEVATAFCRKGDLLWELERPEEALVVYDEVVRRYGTSEVPALQEAVAIAFANKGATLRKLERPEEALATYHEVIRRYGTSEAAALQAVAAAALVDKGLTLRKLERPEEALATYEEVVHRYGTSEAAALQAAVALALRRTGNLLWKLERPEEALAACDEVVRRYGASETPMLREAVAKVLANKAVALRRLKRPEEALATCEEVIRRYGTSEVPVLREAVAEAFHRMGDLLWELERSEEALATYDEVVHRYGTSEVPVLREAAETALLNKGAALQRLERSEEALAIYDEVVRRSGTSEVPALREVVAKSLVNKGAALQRLERSEEALATFDEVVHRYGTSEVPALREAVAATFHRRGDILWESERLEEALATFDEVVHRYGTSEVPALREVVAQSLSNKGAILTRLERPEEALVACDEVVRRYGTGEVPALRKAVAVALVNRGTALRGLERLEEALVACDEVVRRYGTSEVPALREAVVVALVNRGTALRGLERPEEALATFDEVVRRLGESTIPSEQGMTEHALLQKASVELECRRYNAAIRTADLVLEQCRTESLENRVISHLVRARATLESDDLSGCEQDIEALLTLLPELGPLSRGSLVALMEFSIELGPARMHELIQDSPAAPLLLPLTTALEQELGRNPRVAREVDEVAQDIRRELEDLRNANGRRV